MPEWLHLRGHFGRWSSARSGMVPVLSFLNIDWDEPTGTDKVIHDNTLLNRILVGKNNNISTIVRQLFFQSHACLLSHGMTPIQLVVTIVVNEFQFKQCLTSHYTEDEPLEQSSCYDMFILIQTHTISVWKFGTSSSDCPHPWLKTQLMWWWWPLWTMNSNPKLFTPCIRLMMKHWSSEAILSWGFTHQNAHYLGVKCWDISPKLSPSPLWLQTQLVVTIAVNEFQDFSFHLEYFILITINYLLVAVFCFLDVIVIHHLLPK